MELHTPWATSQGVDWTFVMGSDGVPMGHCARENHQEVARIFAAAPELLAVAQFFLRGIEGGHIKCAPYIDFDPNAEHLDIKAPADRLREAIAKATGVAP